MSIVTKIELIAIPMSMKIKAGVVSEVCNGIPSGKVILMISGRNEGMATSVRISSGVPSSGSPQPPL